MTDPKWPTGEDKNELPKEQQKEPTEKINTEEVLWIRDTINEYYKDVSKITNEIENEMGKKGGFDFLRPDFWKDLAEIEKEFSPEKTPSNIIYEKAQGLKNIDEDIVCHILKKERTYWKKLIEIDVYYHLKRLGYLSDSDREIFLSAMPPRFFSFSTKNEIMRPNNYIPIEIEASPQNKRSILEILNNCEKNLKQIADRKNIDKINNAIKDRLYMIELIHPLSGYYIRESMPSEKYKKYYGKEKVSETPEEFIQKYFYGEYPMEIYQKFSQQLSITAKEFSKVEQESGNDYDSGGHDWSHDLPYAVISPPLDIPTSISLIDNYRNIIENKE